MTSRRFAVRKRTFLLLVLFTGGLRASSVFCSEGPTAGTLVATGCSQAFVASDSLNWGAPIADGGLGGASLPGATVVGTSAFVDTPRGIVIDATTNFQLQRADTVDAWNGTAWVNATTADNINTFGGNFNAPSNPSTTAPYGPNGYPYQFGDPLLGATGGSAGEDPELTLNFSEPIYGIAFDVSSASNPNFIATLDAYNSLGTLLGVYQVNTNGTGGGGTCSGLTPSPNPVPCNDAPLIQVFDTAGGIASVVLTVNDNSGLYIDQLELTTSDSAATPEPKTAALIGVGLIILALAAKRA